MRFSSLVKSGRTKSTHNVSNWEHPDLPLSSNPSSSSQQQQQQQQHQLHQEHDSSRRQHNSLGRSISVARDRPRSIAILPSPALAAATTEAGGATPTSSAAVDPASFASEPSRRTPSEPNSGLGRAKTVVNKRDHPPSSPYTTAASPRDSQHYHTAPGADFAQLSALSEQHIDPPYADSASMSGAHNANAPGKTSSDSGQNSVLDRWSQRRLQRLNTEQGFREQRQGSGQSAGGFDSQQQQPAYNNNPTAAAPAAQQHPQSAYTAQQQQQDPQPQSTTPVVHQAPQPHPSGPYPASRTAHSNSGLVGQTSRSSNYPPQDSAAAQPYSQSQTQYSPHDAGPQYTSQEAPPRTSLQQARGFSQPIPGADDPSMTAPTNGSVPASKSVRSSTSNRQSVHNGFGSRDHPNLAPGQQSQPGMPAFNAATVQNAGQPQQRSQQEGSRNTPQPQPTAEDMSEDDVNQLIKDHKELREKYTKVKRLYFEKEDQVKQLQNSLAHQRLSQSRTSLDDSEYSARFSRLDGLIAQLAFSIRKSWRAIPTWLIASVNKDAVSTGKQEMTAAGRAFISCWLVDEVFNKYFHPDLEPSMSQQLKMIQSSIRRAAPPARNAEEEEYLTSKVVNWRLSTIEGLQEVLRSPQSATYRTQLTESLKESLINDLSIYLENPPMSDLEGGVHMITELVVSIAIHLPVESRDVVIDYFMPGSGIMTDHMKLESGIPPLTISVADDAAERASMKSATSDLTDGGSTGGNGTVPVEQQAPKKRSMLGALTGAKKSSTTQVNKAGAGGSSSSLNRPESAHGPAKEDAPPRVRMSAGIGVQIRGRTVLVKAPVFST